MYFDYRFYQPPIGRLLQLLPAEPSWYGVYGKYHKVVEKSRIEKHQLDFWAVVQRFENDDIYFIGVIRDEVELTLLPDTWNDLPFLGYSYPECEMDWETHVWWQYEQEHKAKES
jgi:hypothetical protein